MSARNLVARLLEDDPMVDDPDALNPSAKLTELPETLLNEFKAAIESLGWKFLGKTGSELAFRKVVDHGNAILNIWAYVWRTSIYSSGLIQFMGIKRWHEAEIDKFLDDEGMPPSEYAQYLNDAYTSEASHLTSLDNLDELDENPLGEAQSADRTDPKQSVLSLPKYVYTIEVDRNIHREPYVARVIITLPPPYEVEPGEEIVGRFQYEDWFAMFRELAGQQMDASDLRFRFDVTYRGTDV